MNESVNKARKLGDSNKSYPEDGRCVSKKGLNPVFQAFFPSSHLLRTFRSYDDDNNNADADDNDGAGEGDDT